MHHDPVIQYPDFISCTSQSRLDRRVKNARSERRTYYSHRSSLVAAPRQARSLTVRVNASAPNTRQMLVIVPPHPLVKHWMAIARSKDTPGPIFRNAIAELGHILIYEASRDWLPTMDGQVRIYTSTCAYTTCEICAIHQKV